MTSSDPRRLLPLIVTMTAMGVLAMSIIVPALPDLADELGVSRGAIGLVHGAVAIPGIFLAAYIGYLADRFGRRRVIRVSLVLFGGFGLACFFARSFWLLVAMRGLQGLGTSGLLSLPVVVIGDIFTGHERRWAMGLNLATLTGTTTLAPVIGGFLAVGGAFRPFLVFVVALPVFVWARGLPDPGPIEGLSNPLRHFREALGHLRERGRLSDFLGVLPVSLLVLGVYLGLGLTVLPLFLEADFGLSVSERGLILAILSGASTTASLMSGRIGKRLSPRAILTGALTLEVVGFSVLAASPSLWVLSIGLVALGSGSGSIFPLLQDYTASVGPARYRGVLVGTWVSANRMAQFGGPTAGTALADGIGIRETHAAAAAVVATVALTWMPLRALAKKVSTGE